MLNLKISPNYAAINLENKKSIFDKINGLLSKIYVFLFIITLISILFIKGSERRKFFANIL